MSTNTTTNTPRGDVEPHILHLDDGRLWRGGQHQVWLLLRELAQRGVAQSLAARPGAPLAERAAALGVEVHAVNFRGEWDPFAAARVAALARASGANILHAHTGHAHAIALRAARRLRRAGGECHALSTRRVDFPVAHGWFSRRKYQAPDQHFIAISEGVRRVLIEGGVAPGRISLVPSGVPPIPEDAAWTRGRVRNELGISPEELAIVNIGALTDHKGQRWLIEAAQRVFEALGTARIHILGEGELRGELETAIRARRLEGQVVLHGFVEDARLKLAGFDLFVSSSHLEGLGTVILDAMLAGLPVVAAAAGGVTDIVRAGETGRLVPARDGAALAGAIIEALRERAESGRMARAARRMAQTQYSAAAMAEGTLAVYRMLLGA